MKCFWCGEEIDDDSTKCKYCGIKIDKEAIEKRRLAHEKDKRDFNYFGYIGLLGAMFPVRFFTELIPMTMYSRSFDFYNILFSIISVLCFGCSIIGTIIAIKNKYDQTVTIMFSVGIVLNALWILLYLNLFIKGTTLLSIVGLIIFAINQKNK